MFQREFRRTKGITLALKIGHCVWCEVYGVPDQALINSLQELCFKYPDRDIGMKKKCCIILLLCLAPLVVAAEMYECDGVWTNRPCGTPAPQAVPDTANKALESSAAEILADPEPERPEAPVQTQPSTSSVPQEKRLMIAELKKMNKTCDSYYSPGVIRQFERECMSGSVSVADCYEKWNELQSEMLGRAQDDTCRTAIFSATNRLESL